MGTFAQHILGRWKTGPSTRDAYGRRWVSPRVEMRTRALPPAGALSRRLPPTLPGFSPGSSPEGHIGSWRHAMTETFHDQKLPARRSLPLKAMAGCVTAVICMSYAIGSYAAHAPRDVGIGASSCAATVEMLGDMHFDRIVTAWSS